MATKIIPEQRIFICDVCGGEGVDHRFQGKIMISAIDYDHYPNGKDWEVCDKCLHSLRNTIFDAVEFIRTKALLPVKKQTTADDIF